MYIDVYLCSQPILPHHSSIEQNVNVSTCTLYMYMYNIFMYMYIRMYLHAAIKPTLSYYLEK